MTKEIKLIAVDLDGTLLNSKHELSEANEKALQDAMAQGVQVVLATGKTFASAEALIVRLNLTTPGIYNQGLAVYNSDGSLRHQQTLDPALARRVITFAEDRGFLVLAYSGSRLLMRSDNYVAEKMAEYGEPPVEFVGPLLNVLDDTPINKLLLAGDPRRVKALRWQLGMQFEAQLTFVDANVTGIIEVLPPGASKGRALVALLRTMGVSPEHVLAIGDGENDTDMLRAAGIGVAVGNADARLKAVADHVVASNDEDGVAEAVRRFVLAPPAPADAAENGATAVEDRTGETQSE